MSVSFSDDTGIVPAKILYAGVVPGSVGLYQFNVVVPELTGKSGYATIYMNIDRGPTIGPRYPMIPVAK